MTTNPGPSGPPGHVNRLAREKSPYLLQHAHNPVDWFAWKDEAFQESRRANKPIFLSIGYSTCHWCHVMERESFENDKIAQFLNRHFVSIKVDREERPDVDRIYMRFVQATTGQGGWPLNVFLTPELKPFFGGTYFAPDQRYGRPGFLQLLEQIQQLWEKRRNDLTDSAAEIHARLEQLTAAHETAAGPAPTPDIVRNAGLLFKQTYDPRHGGFGGAPKFPHPAQPQFLLRCGRRFRDREAIDMVLHTCDRMAAGGIHDQLGGGFARYSVDAQWLVPHFEKMLYDNAQLAQLYLDAFLISRDNEQSAAVSPPSRTGGASVRASRAGTDLSTAPLGARTAPSPDSPDKYPAIVRDILEYVLRDMTHPEGGFYSAEDADSEGHEGKFYCWTRAELEQLLSPEEFTVAVRCFGITEQGNFIDHSHPTPLPGQNVLSVVDANLAAAETARLASAKRKMFEARNRRVRPHRDDKVLASWNGLMLGAFARAYAVFGEERYRVAAQKNLAFIRQKLWVPASTDRHHNGVPPSQRSGKNRGETSPEDPRIEPLNLRPTRGSASLSPTGGEGQGEGATRVQGEGEGVGVLYHRWRDGERDEVQLLEGYAFVLAGVIDLYEATLEPGHLDFALALAESLLARFYDPEHGGFWQTVAAAPDLILRSKESYDGAEPSGNSVAVMALLKLGAITGRREFRAAADQSLTLFAGQLRDFPQSVPVLLQALDFSLQEPKRVVVAGELDSPRARELLRAAHSVYQPNKVVLGTAGPVEDFSRTLPARDGPVVYLCEGTACQAPTSDAETVKQMLR